MSLLFYCIMTLIYLQKYSVKCRHKPKVLLGMLPCWSKLSADKKEPATTSHGVLLAETLSLACGSCLGSGARDKVGLRWSSVASFSASPALHSMTCSVHRDKVMGKPCSSLICNPQLLQRLCFWCEMQEGYTQSKSILFPLTFKFSM